MARPPTTPRRSDEILGTSAPLREALSRARRAAASSLSVLIQGESGTGKELVARLIHEESPRASGPFVAVNCAAIPRDLLEAELFGHERGAFTGAVATRAGAFERAHGGTLFLDEVGDMGLEHQAKILRALQEQEVQRVGGDTARRVDVRIVAATHRDLRQRAADGAFREDLLYRLAGYRLPLPPLRERGADTILLARAILRRFDPKKTLARDAERLLLAYPWPGNVRELENVVRASAVDSPRQRIPARCIRDHLQAFELVPREPNESVRAAIDRAVASRGMVTVSALAQDTGVSRATALRALRELVRADALRCVGRGRSARYVPGIAA